MFSSFCILVTISFDSLRIGFLGAVVLVALDATHKHTSDNTDLTQGNVLISNDTAHKHTTENVNLFLPIIFSLFVSFIIGEIFNKSMYVTAIRVKGLPFLNEKVPMCNELITAE